MIWSKNLPPLEKRRGRSRTRLVSIVWMLREHWHLWKGLEKKTVFTESLRRRNSVNVFEVVRSSAKMSFPVCCLVSVKLTSFLSWIFHVIPVSCIGAKCVCISTTLQRLTCNDTTFQRQPPTPLTRRPRHVTSRSVALRQHGDCSDGGSLSCNGCRSDQRHDSRPSRCRRIQQSRHHSSHRPTVAQTSAARSRLR